MASIRDDDPQQPDGGGNGTGDLQQHPVDNDLDVDDSGRSALVLFVFY